MAWYTNLFSSSGSSGGSGNIWGDIIKGVIGGIGAAGAANSASKADDKDAKQNLEALGVAGLQQRKTSAFEAELLDYYKQQDNQRKRVALDTYGQFSTMNRVAPGYKKPVAPVLGAKPVPTV